MSDERDPEHAPVNPDAPWIAPGGARRALAGLLAGLVVGALVGLLVPRNQRLGD